MAKSAIEVVRELYPVGGVDLAAEGALDNWIGALAAVAHPDFVAGDPNNALLAMASDPEEFARTWRDWLSAWDAWKVEILGHEEGSSGRIVVAMNIEARSRKDAVDVPMRGANVVEVEKGRVRRIELHFDRDAARRAAGLAS